MNVPFYMDVLFRIAPDLPFDFTLGDAGRWRSGIHTAGDLWRRLEGKRVGRRVGGTPAPNDAVWVAVRRAITGVGGVFFKSKSGRGSTPPR